MGKEPQAPSAWAIAVGLSNLTLRHFTADQGAAAYDAVLTLASARIQTLLLLDELAAGPADRMKRVQNGGETM
jgi:hypothetical protein